MTTITKGNRTHIAIIGRRNSGKSTLINTLSGQDTALVSPIAGTTTDPVRHAIELDTLGPCMLFDTAGFDDEGELGRERVKRTAKVLEQADLAVLVIAHDLPAADRLEPETAWINKLQEHNIPFVTLLNTGPGTDASAAEGLCQRLTRMLPSEPAAVDVRDQQVRSLLIRLLTPLHTKDNLRNGLLDGWIRPGDLVVLVMPQDKSAPQGRLILPQSQTIRTLIASGGIAVSVSPEQLPAALEQLKQVPDLIIADSQVLSQVRKLRPSATRLTTFSILFAAQKGDIHAFVEGSKAIDHLRSQDRILIAESCSHAPLEEDIGRVRIPALLRSRVGEELSVDICSGTDFPADLTPYALIIQCGSCMQNRAFVMNRLRLAAEQGVPMTNYGVAIARLSGILDQIDYLPPYLT